MLKAKKSLGQNFLQDETVLKRIVESANLSQNDVVIEIGPGYGALTEKLAEVAKKIVAIELDDRLIEMLRSKLHNKENVEIIHGDILKINLPKLVTSHLPPVNEYKVVANIPYYITAPIIKLFLETEFPPSEMILMVQKEVAERICAKAGEMSILAVSVQYYAKPEYLFTVPKTAFEPVPKVDSAVIKVIRNKEQKTRNKDEVKKFFRIVRAGFSAKRKTLANNLSSSLKLDKKTVEEKIESIGFLKNVRAQELGVEDWKKLTEIL
ncbi:MAG TPA: 16S rRNA (adenine(1518)-N(6)/adenine(1519)-N(6))-dimethyltransferase RsmA [Candidatus Moranbacteria bacterium]|nr:16S rRNA (adenine(1518)-N(6)/adenine(1519)-N(6))-dimethyltransferase RsmA [Candidatus Moranbacteria bacterium]